LGGTAGRRILVEDEELGLKLAILLEDCVFVLLVAEVEVVKALLVGLEDWLELEPGVVEQPPH
jgi:hypothetical protein